MAEEFGYPYLYAAQFAVPAFNYLSEPWKLSVKAKDVEGAFQPLPLASSPSQQSENLWYQTFSPLAEPLILRSSADSAGPLPTDDCFDLDDLEDLALACKQGEPQRGPQEDDLESWLVASLTTQPAAYSGESSSRCSSSLAAQCTMGQLVGPACATVPLAEPLVVLPADRVPSFAPPSQALSSDSAALLGADGASLTRKQRVERYLLKRARRSNQRVVKYHCRKAYADARPRIKGRFVKPEELEAYLTAQKLGN